MSRDVMIFNEIRGAVSGLGYAAGRLTLEAVDADTIADATRFTVYIGKKILGVYDTAGHTFAV